MPETNNLHLVLILLAAAVVVVALFRRFNMSPLLGYLAAGCLIGPGGLRIVKDVESTRAIAELGVVFLLFIIGLELSWERLKAIRKQAFLLGILQIILTSGLLFISLCWFGFDTKPAILIASGLSLSSTALVMQLVAEHKKKNSQTGRVSLTVLLIQDLAVVPLLVLVPALANSQHHIALDLLGVFFKALMTLSLILIVGRLLLRPLYRFIASLRNAEIFTALTLLVVLGTSVLTQYAGLSLALGAFIAGLLMAETEYRHQVEADVMPYKDLLLGLFFMSVGMTANLRLVWDYLPIILGATVLLMAIKAFVIIKLNKILKFGIETALVSGMLLSQGGEFAFILFKLAAENHFFPDITAQLLNIIVILSMILSPFLVKTGIKSAQKFKDKRKKRAEESLSEMIDLKNHVIILGFGRVGQTLAKLLSAENIDYIALDMQVGMVSKTRKMGLPVYYGDGSRREILNIIGVERASAAIVTINDPKAAEKAVIALRTASAGLPIIARATDLERVQLLEAAGANLAISEMFETSLQLGGALLKALQVPDQEITRILDIFRDRDYSLARGTVETGSA